MRAGHILTLLVAGLALVQCSLAADQPPAAKAATAKAAIQAAQERPSLDKDFYDSTGYSRFETKNAAEVPVPNTKANWPSLEQEREQDMNLRGWYDPRVSRGWEPKPSEEVKEEKKVSPPAEAKEMPPIDQQFYEAGGYVKFETKHADKKPASVPSIEEQREEHFNKQGWYDPRFSRRWEAIKAMTYKAAPASQKNVHA